MDRNNRILVAQGLARIRSGTACAGINALLKAAGRDASRCVSSDLGFAVGPRLNAAGRLEDMGLGIACLLAETDQEAMERAHHLDALNRDRRQIEARMQADALEQIDTEVLLPGEQLPWGLCLYQPSWHAGVVGLVASRLKERFHRPVVAFAPDKEGLLKGSARSIPGFHIRDALDTIASQHPAIISRFGGHAMAAGMSIEESALDEFSAAFDLEVRRQRSEDKLKGVIVSDGELEADQLTLELAEMLRYAAPWGQGFPEPVFDGCFKLQNWRVVGEKHLKMVLGYPGGSAMVDAIAFNQEPLDGMVEGGEIQLAYRLDVNEFRGNKQLQLMVEYMAIPT